MTEVSSPRPLDESFAAALGSTKERFVRASSESVELLQHGAATIDSAGFPGWPPLDGSEVTIETFVADAGSLTPMSDNEPFVSAWRPLATWIDDTVRAALAAQHIDLVGPAYVTASATPTQLLEGVAHADDLEFVPTDNVGIVAIIGEFVGPRVATASVAHGPLRPMSQVSFAEDVLEAFAASDHAHCACLPNQLVVFPQFAQLHAGPAAEHVSMLGSVRQLLVYRATAAT